MRKAYFNPNKVNEGQGSFKKVGLKNVVRKQSLMTSISRLMARGGSASFVTMKAPYASLNMCLNLVTDIIDLRKCIRNIFQYRCLLFKCSKSLGRMFDFSESVTCL